MKPIATNKKAYFNYFIEETFEAGISLIGSEVKSIRGGHVSILEGYISINEGEAFIKKMYIKNYENISSASVPYETRERKLLLKKSELKKLFEKQKMQGLTIVPTKIYFNKRGFCKLEIGIAKGKHTYDKKNVIKDRELLKEAHREIKHRS
jgi:SsrA-binding protein